MSVRHANEFKFYLKQSHLVILKGRLTCSGYWFMNALAFTAYENFLSSLLRVGELLHTSFLR
jgi:hypothetical protein